MNNKNQIAMLQNKLNKIEKNILNENFGSKQEFLNLKNEYISTKNMLQSLGIFSLDGIDFSNYDNIIFDDEMNNLFGVNNNGIK